MTKATEAVYFVDSTSEAVANRAAAWFVHGIRKATESRPVARVAISGGNTPRRTFELLASSPYREQVPWDRIELYWTDERVVPPDDSNSNYYMARQTLLNHVPLAPDRVFRIRGELAPEEAADEYEFEIRRNFRLEGAEMPVFDLVALGMGPDGHTASLFPHTAALGEMLRIAVANHVPAQKIPWRVTLSWPVLNNARDVFFLIEGKDKAQPLERVLLGQTDPEQFPSQLIRPRNGRLTLLLDEAAASMLPKPGANGEGRLEVIR